VGSDEYLQITTPFPGIGVPAAGYIIIIIILFIKKKSK
jgi:hypothetical protein